MIKHLNCYCAHILSYEILVKIFVYLCSSGSCSLPHSCLTHNAPESTRDSKTHKHTNSQLETAKLPKPPNESLSSCLLPHSHTASCIEGCRQSEDNDVQAHLSQNGPDEVTTNSCGHLALNSASHVKACASRENTRAGEVVDSSLIDMMSQSGNSRQRMEIVSRDSSPNVGQGHSRGRSQGRDSDLLCTSSSSSSLENESSSSLQPGGPVGSGSLLNSPAAHCHHLHHPRAHAHAHPASHHIHSASCSSNHHRHGDSNSLQPAKQPPPNAHSKHQATGQAHQHKPKNYTASATTDNPNLNSTHLSQNGPNSSKPPCHLNHHMSHPHTHTSACSSHNNNPQDPSNTGSSSGGNNGGSAAAPNAHSAFNTLQLAQPHSHLSSNLHANPSSAQTASNPHSSTSNHNNSHPHTNPHPHSAASGNANPTPHSHTLHGAGLNPHNNHHNSVSHNPHNPHSLAPNPHPAAGGLGGLPPNTHHGPQQQQRSHIHHHHYHPAPFHFPPTPFPAATFHPHPHPTH